MDTTFAMMFVDGPDLDPGLYSVPDRLDRAVAERKLATLGGFHRRDNREPARLHRGVGTPGQ